MDKLSLRYNINKDDNYPANVLLLIRKQNECSIDNYMIKKCYQTFCVCEKNKNG